MVMGKISEEMSLEQEIKNENMITQEWLIMYHQRKNQYISRRDDLLHSSPDRLNGMPRGNSISNPSGQKGIKLADMSEKHGQWLELIEEVQDRLPWKMQIILRLRRETAHIKDKVPGKAGWLVYVQMKYCEEVARKTGKQLEDVWIAREMTFYSWWDRIVEYTARSAAKKGLFAQKK